MLILLCAHAGKVTNSFSQFCHLPLITPGQWGRRLVLLREFFLPTVTKHMGIHLLIGILSLIFAVVTLYNIKLVTVAVSWCFLIKLNKMTPLGSHLFNISFKLCVYWNTSHVWLKLLKMIADFASKYILKKALLAQFSGGKNTNVLRWKGTSHQKHTT